MNSNEFKQDLERLAVQKIANSKINRVQLASIGICLIVVVIVGGSLFGFYLAKIQVSLNVDLKVKTVKEGKIETNHTIEKMPKLEQQVEQNSEYQKIFSKMDFSIPQTRNEMIQNLRRQLDSIISISNRFSIDPEYLINQTKSIDNSSLMPVSKAAVETDLVDKDGEKERPETFLSPIFQQPTFLEPGIPLEIELDTNKILNEIKSFNRKYTHFLNEIFRCAYFISQACSHSTFREKLEAQLTELKSLVSNFTIAIYLSEHHTKHYVFMEKSKVALDEQIYEMTVNAPENLNFCVGDNDVMCPQCLEKKADCYYSFEGFCNSQTEWSIIRYEPKKVGIMKCLEEYNEDYSL